MIQINRLLFFICLSVPAAFGGGLDVVQTFPAHGTDDAHPNAIYWVEFNASIQKGSGTITFYAYPSNGVLQEINIADDEVWIEGKRLLINLPDMLPPDTEVWVKISPGAVIGQQGQVFQGIVSNNRWRFRTRRNLLFYTAKSPYGDCVPLETVLEIEFPQSVGTGGGSLFLLKDKDTVHIWAAGEGMRVDSNKVRYELPFALEPLQPYDVLVDTAAFYAAGAVAFVGINDRNQWHFSTGVPSPETINGAACAGEPCVVQAAPPLDLPAGEGSFLWYDSPVATAPLTNPQGEPYREATFLIEQLNENTTLFVSWVWQGCESARKPVQARLLPAPKVKIKKPASSVFEGDTITLNATGAEFYYWTPASIIVGDTIGSQVQVKATAGVPIVVVGENNYGCRAADTLYLEVQPRPEGKLFLPSLFSPNGDGRNDVFRLLGDGVATVHLRIYNKQGVLVFETADVTVAMQQGWDGTYRGVPQPPDVYFWEIKGTFRSGAPLHVEGKTHGMLTLIR
ncbi:T9SS type B sorting domain-containing protein [Thermonema rossianum]|uniref:T9SS type B sorting domain-containing protein n=1 Tax=Thermonema rossianum TaxID=55505 RepID=UPI0005711159|nr:gliding motility-associated C-terminal domain-containing protein [Thermonema rossianum]